MCSTFCAERGLFVLEFKSVSPSSVPHFKCGSRCREAVRVELRRALRLISPERFKRKSLARGSLSNRGRPHAHSQERTSTLQTSFSIPASQPEFGRVQTRVSCWDSVVENAASFLCLISVLRRVVRVQARGVGVVFAPVQLRVPVGARRHRLHPNLRFLFRRWSGARCCWASSVLRFVRAQTAGTRTRRAPLPPASKHRRARLRAQLRLLMRLFTCLSAPMCRPA